MIFDTIGRIFCGFLAQYLGVFVSINVFSSTGGTIFWWTQTAICVAAMLLTPDEKWPERIAHIVSGIVAYVPFRYKNFPLPVLITVCSSNALGQVFAYASMKRFYPVCSPNDVRNLRFLGIFLVYPVIFASVVASIPGSLGFFFWGSDIVLSSVIRNYTLGHISGTVSLLYPLLVVPILWKDRVRLRSSFLYGTSIFFCVSVLCIFKNYNLFGFATIVTIYGLFVGTSSYSYQCDASLIQLACTCSVLGMTAAGRGPFVYVTKEGGAEAVLIGTQMGIIALTAISAFIVILVSQLRDMEKYERHSRRSIEKLAERQTLELYRIGHDMRNNSTLVQAVLEVREEQKEKETLEVVKAINVLNGVLVSDMVDMVSGKKAGNLIPRENVDIVNTVRTYSMVTRGLLSLEGKEKCIKIRLQFHKAENAFAYTNVERLHQVICNLVSNAVKYTESGEIVLGVDGSSSEHIKINVADTGIGMSETDVSQVFELFFRSDRASKVNSGTGLGLSNARNVCDAIDAKIEVSSPGQGKGSLFTLTLPRIPRSNLKRHVSTRFSLHVLVMDDSAVIKKLMTKYLTSFGCEVVCSSSAEESRVICKGNVKFDMVITDNYMGAESGTEFISSIRKGRVDGLHRLLPCIICTGDKQQHQTDPRTCTITKPFSKNDVASALTAVTVKQDDV